jgi:hypothetical protein
MIVLGEKHPRRLHQLQSGQFLAFEEVRNPRTGNPADADPTRRHVVRITRVTRAVDTLYDMPVLEIEWDAVDALPFAFCLSATSDAPNCQYYDDISVARGNLVLADHGRTLGRIVLDEHAPEDLGKVPMLETRLPCGDGPCPKEVANVPGRYRPQLRRAPLTFSQPLNTGAPASAMIEQDPRLALPQIALQGDSLGRTGPQSWQPRPDLLSSGPGDRHYVVEMDDDGRAHLRFGDGDSGQAPQADTHFEATYRIGNGPAGNVGAEAISHIVLSDFWLSGVDLAVRNPLPTRGGTAPEPTVEVKLIAPSAFRNELLRAITPADYVTIVTRDFPAHVQGCVAQLQWNGSWYEVIVAVDPRGRADVAPALLDAIAAHLERFRRIGHDLRVVGVRQVPIELTVHVCVSDGYLRGHVVRAVQAELSNRVLPDRHLGFFHPDALKIGESVLLSKIVALVQSIEGVDNAVVERLHRFGDAPQDSNAIETGELTIGPFEVARLDNDPRAPERGVLTIVPEGGR